MKIKSITEAEAALLPYVPLVKLLTGKDTTLERVRPLMALLGDPQERLHIVHIAGTSGKTSTAYFEAALLHAADKKIGLTVSPHVDSITERVQINGRPLSEKEFCKELSLFMDIARLATQKPSYFEMLYAFALWVFDRQKVDYAVIETGMGGLYDSTNIAIRSDKVCIITDIGYDHMHILGHTLPEIALQKIGIAHKDNAVLMYRQSEEIMKVIRDWVSGQGAKLQVISGAAIPATIVQDLTEIPLYQGRNWLLAYQSYLYLRKRDKLPYLTRQVLRQTQHVQVPGRMEITRLRRKTIIMDGAHNAQKMTAFVQSFKKLYPDSKPAILIALKEGKEYQSVAPLISSIAGRVIVSTFNTSQDLPARSMDPKMLAATIRKGRSFPVECIVDQKSAFQELLSSPENLCIITGSIYLLSQIRKLSA